MDENPSKPPHSHPGSASGSDCSTENNPPEPPSHGGGGSSTKRKITTTSDNNEPQEEKEDNVDNNITHLSTPTKRHQTESSNTEKENKQDTNTTIISPWIQEEIDLLKDILDFCLKKGRYPYSNLHDQQDFFKNWVQERGFYRDETDLSMKMGRLKLTFWMNREKKLNGEDIEAMMDPTEIEIFRLSNRVWGSENDDLNDSKDLPCKDSIKGGMISGHGSNCSSSKDSSSNEMKMDLRILRASPTASPKWRKWRF